MEILAVLISNDRRGSEVFGLDLSEALVEAGRSVHTVALTDRPTRARLDVPVLGPHPYAPRTLRALRRLVHRADVILAHGAKTLDACALATAATGAPFIYRSIGDPQFWASSVRRRVRTGALLRRAASVVALWPAAASALESIHRVAPDRIAVIPNAVRAERFPYVAPAAKEAARQRMGLVGGGPVVVYLGALSPEKCVDRAVAATRAIPAAQLVLVGDGPERSRLQAAVARERDRRVHLLVPVADPGTVLAAADVLVLPSDTEGMPAVIMEAGLCGVPAVASDVGGCGQIIRHGETGILVRPHDVAALTAGIQTALEQAARMGRAACCDYRQRFDFKHVVGTWNELIGRVVAGAKVRAT